jgi:hypothetical protein
MDSEEIIQAIERGSVEKRRINQYSLFSAKQRSNENSVSSSREGSEIYVVGISMAYAEEPVVVNATGRGHRDPDIEGMESNHWEDSHWSMKYRDKEILTHAESHGVTQVSSSRGNSSTSYRVKVTREFVEKFDKVYVVKRSYSVGGREDREQGVVEWDNDSIEEIVKLQPDYQEWIQDLIEKNGGEMYQDSLVTELVGKVPAQDHRIYDVIDRMVDSDKLYRNTRDNRVYLGF